MGGHMARIRKFRLYDVDEKVWVPQEQAAARGDDGTIYTRDELTDYEWTRDELAFVRVDTTGKYDAQGREIYEGDALVLSGTPGYAVVEWDGANACFFGRGMNGAGNIHPYKWSECVRIGSVVSDMASIANYSGITEGA